jgi:very-short-patch-repair endonuclease
MQKLNDIGLVASRQGVGDWQYIFLSRFVEEFNRTGKAGRFDSGNYFQLYFSPDPNAQQTIEHNSYTLPLDEWGEVRTPGLNPEIVNQIAKNLGLGFVPKKEPEGNLCYINNPEVRDDFKTTFAPIDLLDYIYAVLHSPTYCEKQKEFLKIDFPRVPYPKDANTFWKLVKLGGALRQIHLLESPRVAKFITQYPVDGNNELTKVKFDATPIPPDPTPALPPIGGEGARTAPMENAQDNSTYSNQQRSFSPPSEGSGEVREVGKFGYITANPAHYKFIKEMRDVLKDNPTEAEKVIWEYLRNKKTGHKIRRQHIIDDFITDFVCLRKKVVIEIDGKIHLKQKEYDALRTAMLNESGYEVVRFRNEEVFANPQSVADKIKGLLDNIKDKAADATPVFDPTPALPPIGGEGARTAPMENAEDNSTYFNQLSSCSPPDPTPALPPIGGEGARTAPMENAEDNSTYFNQLSSCSPPLEGSGEVGKVYINDTQYFDNVPLIAWEFYIGGYQPAQKWLKDRKDHTLEFYDILRYQKIIVALTETDRLMKEIDKIAIE